MEYNFQTTPFDDKCQYLHKAPTDIYPSSYSFRDINNLNVKKVGQANGVLFLCNDNIRRQMSECTKHSHIFTLPLTASQIFNFSMFGSQKVGQGDEVNFFAIKLFDCKYQKYTDS